jgi:hypothetical protein
MASRRRMLDAAARTRAGRAKGTVVLAALATFGIAYGLTRASHPSHAKHALSRLDAPGGFVRQLQQDEQLQGGVVAAPQAPPEAQTTTS